jgi:hypothetical protein
MGFGDHPVEVLIDLRRAFAGFGELRGLGEWLAQALARVGDLAARAVEAGEGVLLACLQAVQAVLQPGDQPGGIGSPQISGGQLKGAAGDTVEGDRAGRLAHLALSHGDKREAGERTGVNDPRAHAVQSICLSLELVLQVPARCSALVVPKIPDEHRERVAPGVLPAGVLQQVRAQPPA